MLLRRYLSTTPPRQFGGNSRGGADWRDLIPPRQRDWRWPPKWWGTLCTLPGLTGRQWVERGGLND